MSPGKGGDAWFSLEDDIVFPLSLFALLWLVPRGSSDRFDTLQPLSIPDVAPELDLFLPCATLTDISFSLSDEEEWKMSFGSWILEAPIECMFYYNFDINSNTFKLQILTCTMLIHIVENIFLTWAWCCVCWSRWLDEKMLMSAKILNRSVICYCG